ncbi:hypothetical protein OIV83_003697 [Microbotryomycetes sp. JL201]|nr:hypothetical protein OIV83_003697 [Microbotryomycetes sp. JL201]
MFALTPYKRDQPRTLSRQKDLPRLPIPQLDKSLERYIHSLKPFLLQEALERKEKDADAYVNAQLDKRRQYASDFVKQGGLGRLLQERLKDVDRQSPNNWLDDAFWIKVAYHSWRVPLPINSNWWILMADDLGIPEDIRMGANQPKGEFTEWQIKRAAKVIHRLTNFKVRLDKYVTPSMIEQCPFCMHQYMRVFGVTRLPGLPTDSLVHAPHPHPTPFIVVSARDHLYKVPVVSQDGSQQIDLQQIEAELWAVADDAASRPVGPGVGALSGDARDTWTATREHLLALDPQNRTTMTAIEDCLFFVSLDDYTLSSDKYVTSSPATKTPDLDAHVRYGSSSNGTGRNRWWDKGVTVAFENNGRGTMIGEHSPCDALIPSIVADYALAENVDGNAPSMRGKSQQPLDKLEWVLDDKAMRDIDSAIKTIGEVADDSDGKMLWFDEYGVDWIKNVAKQSPDAYLQMALQLAFHKDQGAPVATYETASTRLFKHGRTDVIRTLSEDSWNFVQAMRTTTGVEGSSDKVNPDAAKTLYDLLTKATKAHNTYTRDSSVGKGCDRHFMGLKLMLRPGERHELFEDELFQKSQDWILSTSGLSAGDRFFGTGFGTVWPQGYGINYLAGKNVIKFGIESKHSCETTSTDRFRLNVTEAMRDMRRVCEAAQSQTQAKL